MSACMSGVSLALSAEIYNEEIRDLLSRNPKNKLELKEDQDGGVFVKDLSNYVVKSGEGPAGADRREMLCVLCVRAW